MIEILELFGWGCLIIFGAIFILILIGAVVRVVLEEKWN